MADIFSAFNFGSIGSMVNLLIILGAFLVITLGLTALVIFVVIKSKETKVFQIDMSTKRVKTFAGMYKKNKRKGVTQFWARKLGRFLPRFQHTNLFIKGKRDIVFILTDKNGLYHTMKVPTYEELQEWYRVVHKIELSEASHSIELDRINQIYMLPNPHEDLDWLADKMAEADSEFKNIHWWQHPNIMIIATAFICFMMVVATLILKGKM